MGTFVFWLFWDSAVLVLFFTAVFLLPLVHLLHKAPSYTCRHLLDSFHSCLANLALS